MPRPRKSAAAPSEGAQDLVPAVAQPMLPGEAAVDEEAVDRAVQELTQLYQAKGLETARLIGEYLISTFFGGDPAAFHDHEKEHASFRELARRDDLPVSASFLWNACAVVEQLRLLPEDIAGALPLSHHKLLLPVKDPEMKAELAREAVAQGLSKRDFEEEVKKARASETTPREGKVGRPALPGFVKGLTRLKAAVDLATREAVKSEDFANYSTNKARVLVEELEQQIRDLENLKEHILATADKWDAEVKNIMQRS